MPSPTLFITGATGFIGSHVVKNAIAAGHRVRLSVRKEEQIENLKKIFSSDSSQLDFAVIPDISKVEAFEGKLDGIEHVIHLASPMPGKGDDFKEDYLKPAVEGTLSILKAAKASSSVKRVVVTSSFLAVVPLGSMNATDLKLKGKSIALDEYIFSANDSAADLIPESQRIKA
jgi:nucleoside-diphosphate-sugar epimerase